MKKKLCTWLWWHGLRKLAFAVSPGVAVALLTAELEEQHKRRFWADE